VTGEPEAVESAGMELDRAREVADRQVRQIRQDARGTKPSCLRRPRPRSRRFHPPARALGYKPVMDYRAGQPGIQANTLFLTGLVLSAQKIEITGNALVSTLLTDMARPVLAFLAVRIAGLSGELAAETLLLLAIPAGFFGVLLGLDYGVRPPVAGMTLLLSTVFSVVTLSVLIAFVPRL